jgi:outer membrane protein OmpA-like peptidoglycan-associated protein/sRNA-binding carbon storage regulator CsrA
MKKIILIGSFCISAFSLMAQDNSSIKPSSLAFHLFYNDFNTAQQIKATSLGDVLKNGNWSSFRDMQIGFGANYFKGISKQIDFVATLDGSGSNYLFKDGTTNGSSKFLLDLNAGVNVKLFDDTKSVVPYVFGGTGFSYYTNKFGVYLPTGLGVQFNLFNEAFITTNMQYRFAATKQVNDHFYYTVGIGLAIGRKSKPIQIVKTVVPQVDVIVPAPVEIKVLKKDVKIKIVDEQTHIVLAGANIKMSYKNGEFNAISDANGEVIFKDVSTGNYEIKGVLNTIFTTAQTLQINSFNINGQVISITLSHNDPRFTMVGMVEEKNTNKPVSDASIHILNQTKGTSELIKNKVDGTFAIQLGSENDYVFSAKKNNYISNIDSISTKGLNRSTTLYVKLSLAVEETKVNTSITLANIYYHTGSIILNKAASSDLDKLVLFLTDNPKIKIEIASHSDSRGDASKNLVLSKRRAQEVVNYLQNHGISSNRLIANGYGESRLINGCKDGVMCSEAQHEQNRRTEFKVIGN